jgi:hypothetical protein
MLYHLERTQQIASLNLDLFNSDLNIAFTFAAIARSRTEPEVKFRSRQNARKGYDLLLNATNVAPLTNTDRVKLTNKLESLKLDLQNLGEPF